MKSIQKFKSQLSNSFARVNWVILLFSAIILFSLLINSINRQDIFSAQAQNADHIQQLIQTQKCPNCDLRNADLKGIVLIEADLSGAKLSHANLSNAVLIGSDFTGADLSNADLNHADLSATNFEKADLSDANLTSVDLEGTKFGQTNLSRVNLSNTRIGIEGGETNGSHHSLQAWS